jgi:hypothetical protein
MKEEISGAMTSKHLLLLKDPWHDLNIEKYLSRVRIKCFNSIMAEAGNATNSILESVEVVLGAREFPDKVASDRSIQAILDSTLSPGDI